jgi:DNA-binding transcriptional regulator YiaG
MAAQAPEQDEATAVDPLELIRARQMYRSGMARTIRIGAGLNLTDFSHGLGLTPGAVCRWESSGPKSRIPRGRHAVAALRLLEAIVERQ